MNEKELKISAGTLAILTLVFMVYNVFITPNTFTKAEASQYIRNEIKHEIKPIQDDINDIKKYLQDISKHLLQLQGGKCG